MAKACLVSALIIVMWIVEGHPFHVSTMDIKTTSCPGPHPIQGVVVFHLKPSVVVVVKRPETVRASQAWLAPPPLPAPAALGWRPFFCRAQRVLHFFVSNHTCCASYCVPKQLI